MVRLVKSATQIALSPTLASNEFVVKRRAQGLPVLHMGFGESPFPAHPAVMKALQEGSGRKEYIASAGEAKLCDAVSSYYTKKLGVDTTRHDVIVSPGSKLALYALQMAVEGDVILPIPSWVSYKPQSIMIKTEAIGIQAKLSDTGYELDPDLLRKTISDARTRGLNPTKIILNYPNNPTGLTIPEENLKSIAQVCEEEDIFIISDEIYGEVAFDKKYRSISHYAPDRTAITAGLSKQLSLGGFRIGVCVVPKAIDGLHRLLANIASETWSCIASPISSAALEAYTNPAVAEYINECMAVHELVNGYICRGLREAGIFAPHVQGAFYNYPNLEALRAGLEAKEGVKDSRGLAAFLADRYGLVALPGTAFGEEDAALTLRLSGCDYDGSKAIHAYQSGEKLDDNFVERFAPNVVQQVNVFQDMGKKYGPAN